MKQPSSTTPRTPASPAVKPRATGYSTADAFSDAPARGSSQKSVGEMVGDVIRDVQRLHKNIEIRNELAKYR